MSYILFDFETFCSYLGAGFGCLGNSFFSGFFSIHMKKKYEIKDQDMGLFFGVNCGAYLVGCYTFPKLLEFLPPLVQYYASFFVFGVGCLFAGPSSVFGI